MMEEQAVQLLSAVWRGISPAYKSRYRARIWRQFEDRVRSAAYTADLKRFMDRLCRSLDVSIRNDDAAVVAGILDGGNDRALLKLLREEATLLVLRVRVAHQDRRRKQEEEAKVLEMFPEEEENEDVPF